MAVLSASELFNEQVPRALAEHPDKARAVDAVFRFKITGEGGGDWTVDLTADPPTCTEGDAASAQCTIEVAADDFKTMMSNADVGMQLYFEGKLKLTGDPELAGRLPVFFEGIRESGGVD